MTLTPITTGLISDVTMQLLSNETVYYFSYLSAEGGCLSGARQDYWIAITDKRILYKTKVMEKEEYVERNGILPFEKVSFIEVSEAKQKDGCSSKISFQLRISTSGGTVIIPILTKEKGFEIRQVYSQLTHMLSV